MAIPVAQFDVEHLQPGGETWTNRYLTDMPVGDAGAQALATSLANIHRSIMYSNFTLTRVRHATLAEGDDQYRIYNINAAGQVAGAGLPMMPLWCVVRVDFPAGLGRPSRKYLRGCLAEGNIEGSTLNATTITLITGNYAEDIAALSNIVDPQGEDLETGVVNNFMAMRQLRRGSKRKGTPVLG